MARVLSRLVPLWATLGYAASLLLVATTLLLLGPQTEDRVVGYLSTNLHNLAAGHLETLLGSAFITQNSEVYLLLPGLVCLMALAELVWCSSRLVQAFVVGHIGATLIVAAGLAAAIRFGWLPTSIAEASDVGLSYGAMAVVGVLTAALPRSLRAPWIAWWLTVASVIVVISGADFTAIGHMVALVLGMALAIPFRTATHWTVWRWALLMGGIAFGFLLLVGASPQAQVAAVAGAGVALVAYLVARLADVRFSGSVGSAGRR
jgi:hypothetical protein